MLLVLMLVAVDLTLMSRMLMVVRAVFLRVLMVVHIRGARVGMLVAVLVQVLMRVGVGVFMGVPFIPVSMFVAVFVSVLVNM